MGQIVCYFFRFVKNVRMASTSLRSLDNFFIFVDVYLVTMSLIDAFYALFYERIYQQ